MKKYPVILIILCVFLFIGCEGDVEYSGFVYDAQTGIPLDSAQCIIVNFKDRNNYRVSDSLGFYNVISPMVGCVPNCPEYEVEFSKMGYKTQVIYAPVDVYLEKE